MFDYRFTDEEVDEMYREAPIKNGMFDYTEFTRILKHGAKEKDEAWKTRGPSKHAFLKNEPLTFAALCASLPLWKSQNLSSGIFYYMNHSCIDFIFPNFVLFHFFDCLDPIPIFFYIQLIYEKYIYYKTIRPFPY